MQGQGTACFKIAGWGAKRAREGRRKRGRGTDGAEESEEEHERVAMSNGVPSHAERRLSRGGGGSGRADDPLVHSMNQDRDRELFFRDPILFCWKDMPSN